MLNFTFQTARQLLCAPGATARIGELAADLRCRHALLVCDRGVLGAGLPDRALSGLEAAGIAVTLFTDVRADPPEEIVEAGVAAARAAGADGIVGLGGGSSLDVAKLIALLAPGTERLDGIYGVGLAKGPRLPLILAPTTAGTGSEVTPIAIVTTRSGEKRGVVAPPLLPDWAVLDADLTLGLPALVSAATGIDAMVHAVEAITSKRLRNPVSDALAREALRLIGANIRTVCRDGADRAAREAMLLGSALAGMAFANAPVAAVHALAYPVGARFHVPHGLSNAMVLPGVLAFNAPAAAADYAGIAAILFPEHPGRSLGESFAALAGEVGLDIRLRSAGITEGDLPGLAEDAMRQTRLLVNNPREMREADALAIYRAAL